MPIRPLLPAFLLILAACATDPVAPAPAPEAVGPGPAWPVVPSEDTAPAGYTWTTLHHRSVLARLLVPDGADVTESDDDAAYPSVRITHHAVRAEITYRSTADDLAPFLAVGLPNAPVERQARSDTNVTFQRQDQAGDTHIASLAPGAGCVVDLSPFDRNAASLDEAFTICSSLRPAPLGPWGPPAAVPNGTAVPAGAWVEDTRPSLIGDSLLGPYAPRLYAGWFSIARSNCPADVRTLGVAASGEAGVTLAPRDTAAGPAYVRTARSLRQGSPYDTTRVVAPRGQGCCIAEFPPFLARPSPAELDYVVALCDTTAGK